MFHNATCVDAMPPSTLRVGFADGEVRDYDVSAMISVSPTFEALLADESLFRGAHLSPGGYGIIWNDEVDLSVETVYENGHPVSASAGEVDSFSNATRRS